MEVQIIQARPQLAFGCEDCEEEERQEALQEEIAQDRVNLSQASLNLAENASTEESGSGNSSGENDLAASGGGEESSESTAKPKTELQLTEKERRILNELKARDAEVRAHEAAHLAAAGPYVNGAPTYEYQTGPDGRQYAVEGEVSIDTSPVPGDPEATVRKAQTIKRAALAPREPSGQDRQVAAQAAQLEAQARQEAQAEKAEENEEAGKNNTESVSANSQTENQEATDGNNHENAPEKSPFTKRVKNPFSASPVQAGNLLNIIS